ncbi:MAG TPA: hypothetical protein PKL83_03645 [bacterium]|nr:hypothetical protein [bacterium]
MKSVKNAIRTVAATGTAIALMTGLQVFAATDSDWSQVINAGSQSVDIVDDTGAAVANPAVTFGALTYDFDTQDGTGTFGISTEKVRVYNPTSTATWTVNIAGSATTAVWTDGGSNTYDFNDVNGYTDGADTDSVGGQLTIDPSGGSISGVSGCATTNISAGTSDAFEEGTVDSIDLLAAASGAPTFCRWDYTGASLSQGIPAAQVAASYAINMVVSIQ